MPNRLTDSRSPYLQQHADNPVHWWEWTDAAFAEAADRDVPVLLSVGYATCHWCHVMAHESFEDEATAAFMNDNFVNVKVDREERPDVDRIYMEAVMATTGRGGWPMTVFLTPDARPIFAGTYFPKERMGHHPSFSDVMRAVIDAWATNREGAESQASQIADAIASEATDTADLPSIEDVLASIRTLAGSFDRVNGGFGGAPKFPQAPTLELLMRTIALQPDTPAAEESRSMLISTLRSMAAGGIHDHLLGGFARYSVDAQWTVPHFEKMLYDNAQLARVYLRSWQLTGIESFLDVARSTLTYLDEVLADDGGALHSGEDADSEGEEGKFAVWTWDELASLLGNDLPLAADIYGFSPEGNFEGANNPVRHTSLEAIAATHNTGVEEVVDAKERIDRTLVSARARRPAPARDDKIVAAWNGLAIRTFAEAGAILNEPRYLNRARRIADFLLTAASPDGELARSWRDAAAHRAFAEDHAAVAVGLYALYSATSDERWFEAAETHVRVLRERFASDVGGFYATDGESTLIARPFNSQDSPSPSDNSLAMEALLLHMSYTGDLSVRDELERTMARLTPNALRYPSFGAYAMAIWLTHLSGVDEVAVTGPDARDLAAVIWDAFRPQVALAVSTEPSTVVPLLEGRHDDVRTRAFVCRDLTCEAPVTTANALAESLDPVF